MYMVTNKRANPTPAHNEGSQKRTNVEAAMAVIYEYLSIAVAKQNDVAGWRPLYMSELCRSELLPPQTAAIN